MYNRNLHLREEFSMKNVHKFLKIVSIVATILVLTLLASCGNGEPPDPNSVSTWRFVNRSSYKVKVYVWQEEKADTGDFYLNAYYGISSSKYVTWRGLGESYCTYTYSVYDSNGDIIQYGDITTVGHNKDYNSRTVTFTDK